MQLRYKRFIPSYQQTQTTNPHLVQDVKCAHCNAVFPSILPRCPECGSEDSAGNIEKNPYTRWPLEVFLKACGHFLWIAGTIACLFFLWNTAGKDASTNIIMLIAAPFSLLFGVMFSIVFFALSELLRRIIRLQRFSRAIHEVVYHQKNKF